jgi:hypothetical protein
MARQRRKFLLRLQVPQTDDPIEAAGDGRISTIS